MIHRALMLIRILFQSLWFQCLCLLLCWVWWHLWDVNHLTIELLLQTGQLYSSLLSCAAFCSIQDGLTGGCHGCRCVLTCIYVRIQWRVDRAFGHALLCCLYGACLYTCLHTWEYSWIVCRILICSQAFFASLSLYAHPLLHIVSFVWWERLLIQQHRAALGKESWSDAATETRLGCVAEGLEWQSTAFDHLISKVNACSHHQWVCLAHPGSLITRILTAAKLRAVIIDFVDADGFSKWAFGAK